MIEFQNVSKLYGDKELGNQFRLKMENYDDWS